MTKKSKQIWIKKAIHLRIKICFLLSAICLPLVGISQNEDREITFKKLLENYHIVYKPVEGYEAMKSAPNVFKVGEKLTYSTVYFLESNDNENILGIFILGMENQKHSLPYIGSQYVNHILHMNNYKEGKMVSSGLFVRYMPDKPAILNANIAGEYVFNLEEPFNGIYQHCHLRYIEVEKHALIFVFHLFKKNNKYYINKILEKTFEILKFDDRIEINEPFGK